MIDRELLEAAARAAGYTIRFHGGVCKGGAYEGCERLHDDGEWRPWRPRHDDGDALRLAVAARLGIDAEDDEIWAGNRSLGATEYRGGDDDCAATRLAIVRAAAAIEGHP